MVTKIFGYSSLKGQVECFFKISRFLDHILQITIKNKTLGQKLFRLYTLALNLLKITLLASAYNRIVSKLFPFVNLTSSETLPRDADENYTLA